jgi:hypothetical protein
MAASDPAFVRRVKRSAVVKSIRIFEWWQPDQSSGYVMTKKVGSKRIEFEKGKAAIAVGTPDKLLGVIDALIKAVRAGELDEQLKQSSKFGRLITARRVAQQSKIAHTQRPRSSSCRQFLVTPAPAHCE